MPSILPLARARISQRLELQPRLRQPNGSSVGDQSLAIDRNQVRHRAAVPHVTVQPESAVHRVGHSIPAKHELFPGMRRWTNHSNPAYWQPMSPSIVAGARGVTAPPKIAHVSGYEDGCVARADHPEAVAVTISTVTPGDEL
jgi:CTP:molybdopterin cytidylyltransferase MocA